MSRLQFHFKKKNDQSPRNVVAEVSRAAVSAPYIGGVEGCLPVHCYPLLNSSGRISEVN